MISRRLPADLTPTPLARAVAARRRSGLPFIDLTESNPTAVGLSYPSDLLAALGDSSSLSYRPQPMGLLPARRAVADELARHRLVVDPDRIALTSSTSEAYSLLFKLFCDAGDAVLVPRPSYPLFEHLTRLEAIEQVPYALEYHGTWRVEVDRLERAVDARTRAVLVVSPNNPTGSFLHRDDLDVIVDLCARKGLALIGDEVFADYPLDPAPHRTSVLAQQRVLTCALGGLSKSAGLPQVKLGWTAWAGPDLSVSRALDAFELIADSYLSVSTPVQTAAAALLTRGATVREQIAARLRRNLDALRQAAACRPDIDVLPVEGGWSAVLEVPAVEDEEAIVTRLLVDQGVLVHPGYFFDFAKPAQLIVSLIVEPAAFDAGINGVFAAVAGDRP